MPWQPALVAAVCGGLLAGCSTFGPTGQQALEMESRGAGAEASYSPFNWSPPNYAGMTAGRVIYPGAEGRDPVVAEWVSGKEAESATVTFATPDGNVITYSAGGLKAFEGQLARAEVERHLASQLADLWKTITPEIKAGLVDAICLYVAKGLCS
jgi:ABC-type amino acid transport substrate-binding protein